uniref:USP domain-containing protein n=1 Tax=Zooxanthella nutricula TaxID=1333877 RepID=A0A7S2I3Q4_9DINO
MWEMACSLEVSHKPLLVLQVDVEVPQNSSEQGTLIMKLVDSLRLRPPPGERGARTPSTSPPARRSLFSMSALTTAASAGTDGSAPESSPRSWFSLWPAEPKAASAPAKPTADLDADHGLAAADLGDDHRLVAMICYMHQAHHYVVFVRRLSASDEWIFFNDLPSLPSLKGLGKRREIPNWSSVARECAKCLLCPRALFYESSVKAELALRPKAA